MAMLKLACRPDAETCGLWSTKKAPIAVGVAAATPAAVGGATSMLLGEQSEPVALTA
jgi:hypothetical protein